MDVLADLLPPSYLIKSENISKDNKQKNKQKNNRYKNIVNLDNGSVTENEETIQTKHAHSNWGGVDRRKGDDRREQLAKRGRWLESRDRKDRRKQEAGIFVKI